MTILNNELKTINGGDVFLPGIKAAVDYQNEVQDSLDYLNRLNGTSDDHQN